MHFCYLDESGTPELGAETSHFILLGLAIPALAWHPKDKRVNHIKAKYGLRESEIHTGYIARRFSEQERIPDFATLDWPQRRAAMVAARKQALVKTAALQTPAKLKTLKKLHTKTEDYIHLTMSERTQLLQELADEIGSWTDARLFAEAVDKRTIRPGADVFGQAFENVVTRFHRFLCHRPNNDNSSRGHHGLLIQDNNETVAKTLTSLMRRFHKQGTLWSTVERIIETPLFVDSSLTSMVQMADLCAYATRRYFENQEDDLFSRIFSRFDKVADGKVVGIRHYLEGAPCTCEVCKSHRGEPSRLTAQLT